MTCSHSWGLRWRKAKLQKDTRAQRSLQHHLHQPNRKHPKFQGRWMDQASVSYMYNEVWLSRRKGWVNVTSSGMERPGHGHSKRRKTDREWQKAYEITYWSNLQIDKDELIYKTETGSGDLAQTLLVTKGKGGLGKSGAWEAHTHCHQTVHSQQGPPVEQRQLYSVFCEKPYEKRIKKESMCVTESLCCSPETNTTVNQLHSSKVFFLILKYLGNE